MFRYHLSRFRKVHRCVAVVAEQIELLNTHIILHGSTQPHPTPLYVRFLTRQFAGFHPSGSISSKSGGHC